MMIENFIQVLSQQVFTQSSGFLPEPEFKKLPEWSSLVALILIASVEAEFGALLDGDDILKANTVHDLFNIAVTKKH